MIQIYEDKWLELFEALGDIVAVQRVSDVKWCDGEWRCYIGGKYTGIHSKLRANVIKSEVEYLKIIM